VTELKDKAVESKASPRLKDLPENLTAQIVDILESPDHHNMIETMAAIRQLMDKAVTPLVKALEQYKKKSNWDYGIYIGTETLHGRDTAVKALDEIRKVQTTEDIPAVIEKYQYLKTHTPTTPPA
jgi:hypothetical protein